MSLEENSPENRSLSDFKMDARLAILHTISDKAAELSAEYGEDSAKYPPGHPKYSPFFSGQYSSVVGDNLRDLLLVIEDKKGLPESHLTQKDILSIRTYILASHEKLKEVIGKEAYQKAIDILAEIILSSDFEK
jgi:hypothetical protein